MSTSKFSSVNACPPLLQLVGQNSGLNQKVVLEVALNVLATSTQSPYTNFFFV